MLNYNDFEEKTIERQEIFKGKIIDVYLDTVALPSGETAKRELVFHPGGVGVIPILDDGRMLLVKQFRKPMEKVMLEIPAGKIEKNEGRHPDETARRELEEETGYQAKHWEAVSAMYLSPGFANEKLYIYYAEGLVKVENPLPQDEDEVIELYAMSLDELKQAIADEEICDAKTIFAVNYYELKLLKRRLAECQESH